MKEDRTTKRDTDETAGRDTGHGTGSSLLRWSRRKRDATHRDRAPEPRPEPADRDSPQEQEGAPLPAAAPEAALPPVESIDESSDVSGFLRPGVDEALQRVALRRLFHSAKFNVTDGLDVYVDNYRNFEPLGDIVTADMRYHAERLARAAAKLAGETDPGDGNVPADAAPAPDSGPAEAAAGDAMDEGADGGNDGESGRA